ncbi:MAG: DUF5318 family protein [Actinomycetota bacterium]
MAKVGPAAKGRRTGTRARLANVDYSLAKRALLLRAHTGLLSKADICDAHPDLVRAGTHVGEPARRRCPVCGESKLRLLAYVFGDDLKADNGRVWPLATGLRLAADRRGAWCYIVEVCIGCKWNHLSEAYVARNVG